MVILYISRSIADETVHADDVVTTEAEATFHIVEKGSGKGKRKLVSSDGYAYVYKRTLVNGTVYWRCSVRGKSTGCPVVVKQSGDSFQQPDHDHNHESKPGLLTAVQLKTEVYLNCGMYILY